eukprot:10061058-Alexandrium_andersonii.AAC.1
MWKRPRPADPLSCSSGRRGCRAKRGTLGTQRQSLGVADFQLALSRPSALKRAGLQRGRGSSRMGRSQAE